jgi:phytoene dehydrogenase-like protein
VIIGGGHNGLVAAAYLARAGLKVVVLERRHVLGGAAVTEEVFPGFRFSVASYVVSLLRPEIVRELELPKHGLEILPLDGTFTPLDDDYLWRVNDHGRTVRELRRWSPSDAEAYEDYSRLMVEMARFVKPILSMAPPDPGRFRPREWLPVARLGREFKNLPSEQQAVFIQLMTMSAADFLDQWFETDPLKATMSASGIIGTFQGIRSPGTAYVLLHHYMGEIDGVLRAWGIPRGGTGAVSNSIADAARSLGVEIRTEAAVEQLLTRRDEVIGVVLASGEEVTGRVTLSSLDPHQTFDRLVPPGHLDSSFLEEVARYRYRGSSGKVNLALDGLPEFTCLPGAGDHLRGAISFSPGIDYMELAYDDAKSGRFSRRPYIDMIIPTLVDPSMAPPGKHVMSCFVQYAPLPPGRRRRMGRRPALGVRRVSRRHNRGASAEHPRPHPARAGAHPQGHRGDVRPLRGQHLPGRALARAALLQPAASGVGRGTGRRCRTSGCAARPRTRAAGSWARPAVSLPARSSARFAPERRPERWLASSTT